jgi:hypothetical protein
MWDKIPAQEYSKLITYPEYLKRLDEKAGWEKAFCDMQKKLIKKNGIYENKTRNYSLYYEIYSSSSIGDSENSEAKISEEVDNKSEEKKIRVIFLTGMGNSLDDLKKQVFLLLN